MCTIVNPDGADLDFVLELVSVFLVLSNEKKGDVLEENGNLLPVRIIRLLTIMGCDVAYENLRNPRQKRTI